MIVHIYNQQTELFLFGRLIEILRETYKEEKKKANHKISNPYTGN